MASTIDALSGVELATWTSEGDPPTVVATREALAAAGFDRAFAEDVPTSTAFRRAAAALAEGKDRKVSTYSKDEITYAQLDALSVCETDGRIMRQRIGGWKLEGEDVTALTGDDLDIGPALASYTWGDVTSILRAVMEKDGAGSYALKRNGGVYVVPSGAADFLSRLESFASAVNLRFLRFLIPSQDKYRAEVSEAIANQVYADLDQHAEAIGSYSDSTKLGVMDNRHDAIVQTEALLQRVSPWLSATADLALRERIGRIDMQLAAARAVAEAHRPAANGRRIQMQTTSAA
jgi:hypothetical protein